MEDEKNILDATEYILLALNTINDFNEYIEYKEEIEKAIYDIRNSLFNLMKLRNNKTQLKSHRLNLSNNYHHSFNGNKINNITKKNEKSNIFYNKSIRSKFKVNNNKANNKPSSLNKNDKLSKITDIIMKLNSEDYFYEILTKLFGNDLKEKLTSNEVSDELITAVENSIQEIESLKKKDDLKKKKKEEINNLEEMEEEPRKFPINEILGPNDKYHNYTKITKEKNSNNIYDIYQEFDFVKNLRENKNSSHKKKSRL